MFLLVLVTGVTANGQDADSIFAVKKGPKLAIKYKVQPRENLRMLAYRFYVTENAIEKANEFEDLKKLTPGTNIIIPLQPGNFFTNRPPLDAANYRELYYHVGLKDDIMIVSSYANVTKNEMRAMNGLKGNTLTEGQVLFMGWVKYMSKDTANPASDAAYPAPKKKVVVVADTPKVTVVAGLDSVYNKQTNNGMNVLNEKGSAVFFESQGKSTMFYAFHNATPRGAVIKVFNPGNNRITYVKVLGPIPDTKLYSGSIIGISSAAKEALGVTDDKVWCELTYAPN
jgi:hypothetical protein